MGVISHLFTGPSYIQGEGNKQECESLVDKLKILPVTPGKKKMIPELLTIMVARIPKVHVLYWTHVLVCTCRRI